MIFIHIPKNGGVTFCTLLFRNYGLDNVYHVQSRCHLDRFIQLPENDKQNFSVLMGHFDFGYHRLFNGETKYITFLRNPVERMISYYHYVRQSPKNNRFEALSKLSFDQFVESDLTSGVDNLQCRMLAGYRVSESKRLEVAKTNIQDDFIFVGILDQFDESILTLKKLLGWKKVAYTKRNVAPRTNFKLSANSLHIIQEKNRQDFELYHWVLKSRFNSNSINPVELLIYKQKNRLYNTYVDLRRALKV